ncbi:ArsC/Spx/MgsR family protein [Methylomonas methanica]|uniref:Nitrogenase-associated protein n=1 Tax=Methylomonas methanica (strain DSM 25384 / MC09) TaxID=857087 RepID=G0A0V7_METMM|nr:ArsC/Spx/MgsR family protein [Methylomonas methanica]AEG00042.1 nitrogenase-associated protein [Methylomonas methanica MC09]
MAIVHFYEKPGCFNNTRQKQMLVAAGHLLIVHDLLQFPWADNRQRLRSFFADLPVPQWFNNSAPAIKSGEIDPSTVSETQAIEWMVANPILIRRPLLEVEGRRRVGFDVDNIDVWLGLAEAKPAASVDLETCPKLQHAQACQP